MSWLSNTEGGVRRIPSGSVKTADIKHLIFLYWLCQGLAALACGANASLTKPI